MERPFSNTITCSPSANTSSRLCVTYTIGIRCSWFQARRSSTIFDLVTASSAARGSSSRRIAGSITRARASATLCRSPPEICPGRRSAQMGDAERLQNGGAALLALLAAKPEETVLDVALGPSDGETTPGPETRSQLCEAEEEG